MTDKKRSTKSVLSIPKTVAGKKVKTSEEQRPRSLAGVLAKALQAFEKKLLEENAFKPTLAEYLKLLQLERELGTELPREITVRWVESQEAFKEK